MEIIEGYKVTELGIIPDDWIVKSISEISSPVRGGSPRPAGSPKYFNGNFIPWLTVASLTNLPISKLFVSETETCLTQEGSLHSRILEKGTLIIANSGATLGIAKILAMKCCANDGIAALLDLEIEICKEYLVYFINTKTKFLRDVVATGNGQPNLNTTLIGSIKIPLPPTFTEQTAIATALSDIDALIAQTEKLIEKKKAIKKGLIQKLLWPFDGKEKLKLGWRIKLLGEVFTFGSTANYSRAELSSFDNIEYIHYGDIHTKYHSFLDAQNSQMPGISQSQANGFSMIQEGDVIIADASEDYNGVGKSIEVINLRGKKVIAGLHTILLRDSTSTFHTGFRGLLFESKFIKDQFCQLATGLKVYSLSKSILNQVKLFVPPKDIQESISNSIHDLISDIGSNYQKLEKLKLLKQAMMQSLLTGKIRINKPYHEPSSQI